MKSGILPVNKPEGITSAQVVARVKKKLGAKKAGHAGTLDPFATGLLLCGIDQGTKVSRFFLDSSKRYLARILLGVETDTYDRTGRVLSVTSEEAVASIPHKHIETIVHSFSGIQDQLAPSYSALKHQGRPLYELARKGLMIQKPARQIEIFEIQIKKIDLPFVDIEVSCSSGTYIRSLGFDIGRKLGCGAHLSELCRTASGDFHLDGALGLDEFENMEKAEAEKKILPLSGCLGFMPILRAEGKAVEKIKFGQKLFKSDFIPLPLDTTSPFFQVLDHENEVLAIVEPDEKRLNYKYSCVFSS